MATTTGGQIDFGQMNNEIMQRGYTTQCPLTDPSDRLGYGGTRYVSDLYKSWGATVFNGTYTSKFGTTTGYSVGLTGSMDSTTYTPGYGIDAIASGFGFNYVSYNEGPGFDVINNLIRFAAGNVVRNISNRQNVPPEYFNFDGAGMPGSGTTPVGFRWQ